jgi:hypothetical protein
MLLWAHNCPNRLLLLLAGAGFVCQLHACTSAHATLLKHGQRLLLMPAWIQQLSVCDMASCQHQSTAACNAPACMMG